MNFNNKSLCTISIVIPLNKMFDPAADVLHLFCVTVTSFVTATERSTWARIMNITVKGRQMTQEHTSGLEGHQRAGRREASRRCVRTGRAEEGSPGAGPGFFFAAAGDRVLVVEQVNAKRGNQRIALGADERLRCAAWVKLLFAGCRINPVTPVGARLGSARMMWQRFPSAPSPPSLPPASRPHPRSDWPENKNIIQVRFSTHCRVVSGSTSLKAASRETERDREEPAPNMSCNHMDNGSANSAEAKKTDLRVNEKKCCK